MIYIISMTAFLLIGVEEEDPLDRDPTARPTESTECGTGHISAKEGLERMMQFVKSASGYKSLQINLPALPLKHFECLEVSFQESVAHKDI